MKTKKIFVSFLLFLLTFIIGSILVWSPKNKIVTHDTTVPQKAEIPVQVETLEKKSDIISYETAKQFGGAEMLDEDYWERETKYEFDLLEVGEFHGDEVTAKSSEKWLGFFGKNADFSLSLTSIEVSRVHDEIVDGKNSKKKTGKKVSFKDKKHPLFLLKDAA